MASILIIDDEEQLRNILEMILKMEGHAVNTAENGKVGLKMLDRHHYDLVITDIVTPEQDGFEVMTALLEKSPGTRIIAITGDTAKFDKDLLTSTAHLMRACKVITKPINYEEISRTVKGVLASQ